MSGRRFEMRRGAVERSGSQLSAQKRRGAGAAQRAASGAATGQDAIHAEERAGLVRVFRPSLLCPSCSRWRLP